MMSRRKGQRGRQRTDEEWTTLIFDSYKHFATFSGAGAAVVLVIYQQEILERDLLRYSLVLFGLAAFCCIFGMFRVLVWFPYTARVDRAGRNHLPFAASLATLLLAQAILTLLLAAYDLPSWVIYVVVAIGIWVVLWYLLRDVEGRALLARLRGWRRGRRS